MPVAFLHSTPSQCLTRPPSPGYSRFPIFEDNIDNIIGMVLAKNLIDYLDAPGSLDSATVADIMDPAYYVPQSMAVWNVLEEMRRRRIHMAIVVDEYGGTAGTLAFLPACCQTVDNIPRHSHH